MMSHEAVLQTSIGDLPVRRGKVRDVYDLGDVLLFVASDRISAFDWVLPNGIPDKGRVLTQISQFWFDQLDVPNHVIASSIPDMSLEFELSAAFEGRSMLVRKTDVVPVECVVRGYLSGSGWKEYREDQSVCGIELPAGLTESSQLPEPIFTPATKAEEGHDENISFAEMVNLVGLETSEELRRRSLEVYAAGVEHAAKRGLIIADTKFEWGQVEGEHILIDEVMTPDSSRFWPANDYEAGRGQSSFDKQFVRDWLISTGWDKNSVPPEMPEEIIEKTRAKYIEAFQLLTGEDFSWL